MVSGDNILSILIIFVSKEASGGDVEVPRIFAILRRAAISHNLYIDVKYLPIKLSFQL